MEMVSSVTDQCVISPSPLANIDPDAIMHPDLRIGWEELLGEPVKQYAQSCQLSRILRETHAFRHNLTLTRIITSISRAEQAVYITHIIYTHHGIYAGRNQDGVIIAAS